ncbi:MAG: phosphoribosylglycinamide formyltransferase [Oscillospiraceae bacterium]|jgi:phosphoribosylglycinamide formyltransferase-1|nr:phosphoribosylglycinamide formyltransferase [Oscillospiraceae bacterium]
MTKKRIVVLVSGGGTNLQALIDDRQGNTNGEIVAVLSSSGKAYALERAKAAKIHAEVIVGDIAECVRKFAPDLIVCAGFLKILPPQFCREFANKIINVHPSLIPSFCGEGFYGLKVHEAALARGVKLTGATVHYVTEVCDGGPIIAQKAVAVLPGDTAESLQQRVMTEAEQVILPFAVKQLCDME